MDLLPMKMIDGCSSLATANSARTSFSPSPTCEDRIFRILSSKSLEAKSTATNTHPFRCQGGRADVKKRRFWLMGNSFCLEKKTMECAVSMSKIWVEILDEDCWSYSGDILPTLSCRFQEDHRVTDRVLELLDLWTTTTKSRMFNWCKLRQVIACENFKLPQICNVCFHLLVILTSGRKAGKMTISWSSLLAFSIPAEKDGRWWDVTIFEKKYWL